LRQRRGRKSQGFKQLGRTSRDSRLATEPKLAETTSRTRFSCDSLFRGLPNLGPSLREGHGHQDSKNAVTFIVNESSREDASRLAVHYPLPSRPMCGDRDQGIGIGNDVPVKFPSNDRGFCWLRPHPLPRTVQHKFLGGILQYRVHHAAGLSLSARYPLWLWGTVGVCGVGVGSKSVAPGRIYPVAR
jgi:hypothetical protein